MPRKATPSRNSAETQTTKVTLMRKPAIPTITEAVKHFNYKWPTEGAVSGEGAVYLAWGFGSKDYWLQHETARCPHAEAHICTKEEFNAEAVRLQALNNLNHPSKTTKATAMKEVNHAITGQSKTTAVDPVCKNCKWWDVESNCDFIATIQGEAAHKKGHGADIACRVLDDSGLEVHLKTGPDFGCVNFHPDGQD